MKPNHLLLTFLIVTFAIFYCTGVPTAYAYDPMCEFYEEHNGACCSDCHDMVSCATANLFCVPSPISTPNSGEKPVVYDSINSQVRGTQPYNGVCEVCHTQTRYHRNNASGDHTHCVDKKCTSCHLHGPTTMVSKAVCYTCHGGSAGDVPSGNPPMFATKGAQSHQTHKNAARGPNLGDIGESPGCAGCHQSAAGGGVFTDGQPFATTSACNTCHSEGGAYKGVTMAKANWANGIYEADGKTLKSGKDKWCATCHDNDPAFSQEVAIPDFIVDNDDATFEGTWYYYDSLCHYEGSDWRYHSGPGPYSATWAVPAGMPAGSYKIYARFPCGLIVHNREDEVYYTINYSGSGSDIVGPFNQNTQNGWVLLGTYSFDAGSGSVVLSGTDTDAIVDADAIKWENVDYIGTHAPNVIGDNVDYGYYVTGHKVTCTACHDAGKNHIDHDPRTYEVDEQTSPPQVVNSYEDGYRLRNVGSLRPMVIPRDSLSLDPSNFALCFKCHSTNVLSNERNPDGTPKYTNQYNAYVTYPTEPKVPANIRQAHRYHLAEIGAYTADSDWDAVYFDLTQSNCLDSYCTCTTCHNVHGSPSPVMMRHGELISTPDWDKTPAYDFCYLDGLDSRNCDIKRPSDSVGGDAYFAHYVVGLSGTCYNCHAGHIPYYRGPIEIPTPVNPIVSDPRAKPSCMANDGVTPVLLTAFVTDADGNLSSVKIDLTDIGGISNQDMYDDGSNGDVSAGDDIYSFSVSGTTEPVGIKTLAVTATDDETNTGTGEIGMYVHEPGIYMVDNPDATFACNWTHSTNYPGQYVGVDFQYYAAGGDGSCTATWVFDVLQTGNYNVYAKWTSNSYRATSVPYTVNYTGGGGGSQTVWVNQQENGGTWYLLGTYNFAAGTSGSVVLSDDATGGTWIVADSIKWELQP